MTISVHKLLPVGIILGSLIFFAGIFFWGILPFQNAIIGKANDIEARRTLQENQESRVKELPQLKERYNRILQNESILDMLVSHDQIVPFVERIEGLAHDNDVEITITNQDQGNPKKKAGASSSDASDAKDAKSSDAPVPASKKKKDDTILGNVPINSYMSLRLDVRGKYASAFQFLHQIEALPYALDVVGLDIRRWEPSDTASRGDVIPAGIAVSPDGQVASPENPADKDLVQAFFDVVVYTKD